MSIQNTSLFSERLTNQTRLRRVLILSALFLCLLVPACSSKKVGRVKHGLLFVENKYYSYKTPDGKSGSTNQIALVLLDDGKEVPALPYANWTTDGTHHAQLTKEGQRVELEPPLDNTELWRMGRILEEGK